MNPKRSGSVPRRRFLRGVGTVACCSPLLSGLLRNIAQGEGAASPLRFYLLFTGNGQMPEHWIPTPDGNQYQLAPALQPLSPFRDKLLQVHGLSGMRDHTGGMTESTTGRPPSNGGPTPTGGPSIDQFFAEAWRGTSPLTSLELGVLANNRLQDHTCFSATGLPLPAISSPLGGFERAFASRDESAQAAERRRVRNLSVLDSVSTDLASLQDQLGAETRVLLDEHLTLVRKQEQSLQTPQETVHCDLPATPQTDGQLTSVWKAHHDTIATAFRCGVTRVATVRVGGFGGADAGTYSEIGIHQEHHTIAHGNSADPVADELAINSLHSRHLADLISQLDAIPEGRGTLLDNTVVVWLNELGLGPINNHSRLNQHVLIAGGGNAGLNLGGYFDLGGIPYQHSLLTLVHALGFRDVTKFGDEGTAVIPEFFA